MLHHIFQRLGSDFRILTPHLQVTLGRNYRLSGRGVLSSATSSTTNRALHPPSSPCFKHTRASLSLYTPSQTLQSPSLRSLVPSIIRPPAFSDFLPSIGDSDRDKKKKPDDEPKDDDDASGGNPFKSVPPAVWVLFGASLLFLVIGHWPKSRYGNEEITWKEFNARLLESGRVESLKVHGDHHVAVFLKDSVKLDGGYKRAQYFFSIGSLASFEKKLSSAQSELGIPVAERIPLSFAKDTDTHFAVTISHSLVLIAAILMMFRGMTKMGGGPGVLRQLTDSKF